MTGKQFKKAATLLYSEFWVHGISKALNVSKRTVRRWAAEESTIPEGIAEEVKDLLADRWNAITDLSWSMENEGE